MSNRLQLNLSETEVLWRSFARHQHQIPTGPVHVGDTSVLPVRTVRDLGVYIDTDVTITPSNTQCASFADMYHLVDTSACTCGDKGGLLQLSSLGYFRTTEKWSYVLRLPCGQHETSGGVEDRLQHSTSVWTTLAESFRENSVPVMCSRESLHNQHGAVIPCWDPPLDCRRSSRRSSRRRLRSASTLRLVIPSTQCTTLNDQAFPVTAARVWNALPSSVRSAASLLQFLCNLKTALSVIILFTIVSSCVTDCNF